mgnify:CR=1 FL=1
MFGVVLTGILLVLFHRSLFPDEVVFSNDGPLGAAAAEMMDQPGGFRGLWVDLNSIGYRAGSNCLTFTATLLWILGPVNFAKFYPPLALMIIGWFAWLGLRQLKLGPAACALGALAMVLNGVYFTVVAWGVAPHAIAASLNLLAVGLATNPDPRHRWLRLILAGMCVGMGIMEGFDVGAIYSMVTGTFLFFWTFLTSREKAKGFLLGLAKVLIVALSALFLSIQAISALWGTQVKGVAGMGQDEKTRQERWDWATTWSFPKRETLAIFIPGLFGYRMDTPHQMAMFQDAYEGGAYWGASGRDPAWDRYFASGRQGPAPMGMLRHSGGGCYAGVMVLLIVFWAFLQSRRKGHPVFSREERTFIWFWSAAMLIGLLLAYGRFAPFYRLVYELPYFSTIRNPGKLLQVFNLGLVLTFALGVEGFCRTYLRRESKAGTGTGAAGSWWQRAEPFDRRFLFGCFAVLFLCVIGWIFYASSRQAIQEYMESVFFSSASARMMAAFSIKQVGWFILTLAACIAGVTLVVRGTLAGKRSTAGITVLGALMVLDMARANLPFIVYWDYKEKYATNFLIDFLRERPYEQRVAILPFDFPDEFMALERLYRIEWAQHHFLMYNIQSLDVVQMPRRPQDLAAWDVATYSGGLLRRWELSNTRYLFGPAVYLQALNEQLDPTQRRFRIALQFDIVPKPGVTRDELQRSFRRGIFPGDKYTAVPDTNGLYALFEFTGVLPRAKLYSHWKVSTNDPVVLSNWVAGIRSQAPAELAQALAAQSPRDQATLKELIDGSFNPHETVLLAEPLPEASAASTTNQTPGTVEYESYAPKRIVLKAEVNQPSVLLLNDRYDPNWRVRVNGRPAELLRCNFIMRGVFLEPGTHTVEFSFEPPVHFLYVSLAAILLGVGLVGFLIVSGRREGDQEKPKPPAPV